MFIPYGKKESSGEALPDTLTSPLDAPPRDLVEASILVTISPDGLITDVNEATVKVTGVAREELIGSDFSDYFTEPEKAREG